MKKPVPEWAVFPLILGIILCLLLAIVLFFLAGPIAFDLSGGSSNKWITIPIGLVSVSASFVFGWAGVQCVKVLFEGYED